MFVHTLPTTRPVSFADQLISTHFALELTQTTEKRATLQHVLKTIQDEKVAKEDFGGGGGTSGGGGDVRKRGFPRPGSSNGGGGGGGGGGGDLRSMAGSSASASASASISASASNAHAPALLTQKDWLKAVQVVDDYLPWAASIDQCLKTDDVLPRSEMAFSWKDTLAAFPSKVTLPGMHFELLYVLLVSGKAASNLAASLVASVGDYEQTEAATLDTEARKKKEERLRFAADLYCRAAGTFDYAGSHVVREWENEIGPTRLGELGRSAESTREMCLALSRLAQAEAELVAIRKLLSPTLCYQTSSRSTAPPLPSTHPSPSLLAKLCLNTAALFGSALSLSTTASQARGVRIDVAGESANASRDGSHGSGPKPGGGAFASRLASKIGGGSKTYKGLEESTRSGKVAPGFLKYLSKSARVSQARAYIWLGIDKGERGDYGDALSFLRLARDEVADLASSSAASKLHLGSAGAQEHRREQKRHFALERDGVLDTVQRWSAAYTQLNDTVGFKPIPPPSSLTSQVPAGRGATTTKPFSLGTPAFGPGSVGFVSAGMERLRGLDGGIGGGDDTASLDGPRGVGMSSGPGNSGSADSGESYAGQGAYY